MQYFSKNTGINGKKEERRAWIIAEGGLYQQLLYKDNSQYGLVLMTLLFPSRIFCIIVFMLETGTSISMITEILKNFMLLDSETFILYFFGRLKRNEALTCFTEKKKWLRISEKTQWCKLFHKNINEVTFREVIATNNLKFNWF